MAEVEQVAFDTAIYDAEGSRALILPPATGTLAGGGLYDFCAAVSRPLTPEDIGPLDLAPDEPVKIRAVKILSQLLEKVDLLDVLAASVTYESRFRATMSELLLDSDKAAEFLKALEDSYVEYARDYVHGYIALFKGAFELLAEGTQCEMALKLVTVEALIAALDSGQDVDFSALLVECPFLTGGLGALAVVGKGLQQLRDQPLEVLAALLDLQGEIAVAVLEVLNNAKIRDWVERFVGDHVEIGQMYGTLIGFIIWDIVVDEIITLGFGKGARAVKWLVK